MYGSAMFVNDDICTLPPPPTPEEQGQKQLQSSKASSSALGKIYTLAMVQAGTSVFSHKILAILNSRGTFVCLGEIWEKKSRGLSHVTCATI